MPKTKVLICNYADVVHIGLQKIFKNKERFSVAESQNHEETLKLIKSPGTDAAVLKKENISFTKKENEIAKLVLKEYKNKEIAEALSISHKTVETHIHNIIKKLKVRSRAGMVKYADKNFLRRIAPKHWGFGG